MSGFIGGLECIGFNGCLESDDHLRYHNDDSGDVLYVSLIAITPAIVNYSGDYYVRHYYIRFNDQDYSTIGYTLSKEAIIAKLASYYKYAPALTYLRQQKIVNLL